MQAIGTLFATYTPQQAKHWRHDFIDEFAKNLNEERSKGFYFKDGVKRPLKPLTTRFISIKVSHLREHSDLHYLASIARDAKNRGESYAKVWFGSLKPR